MDSADNKNVEVYIFYRKHIVPKKRSGPKKHAKIDRLMKEANICYHKVRRAWRGALEYARKAGEALHTIRWETDNWKLIGWKPWIKEHFDGSYETATVYIRIYKKWNDKRLVKARKNGLKLTSIKAVLDILRAQNSDYEPPSMSEREMRESGTRQELREMFAAALRDLCLEELEVFEECFDEYWEDWYKIIYDDACKKGEYDLNEYLWEMGRLGVPQNKRKSLTHYKEVWNKEERLQAVKEMQKQQDEIAERVVKALNKKRN